MAELFRFMLLVTTSVSIIFYLACILAALWLKLRGRMAGSAGFVAIALVALAYSLWAFYGAGWRESLWSLGMTAVAIPVYLIMRAAKNSSRAAGASPAASPESAA